MVLVVGAVVVTLAILGFKRLAQFAVVCSPWMFLMFFAGAVAMLPPLAAVLPDGRIDGFADLWTIANRTIWKGASADGGGLGFWHVVAFAWLCNLAMHVGLSDMALFRFARHWRYGLFSAFGMYLGHYLAWITAGVMGAAAAFVAQKPLAQLDSGDVASQALGVAGALAVVTAGWTTANPTLYRAGLALQVITPDWPRWRVTLIAGALTTVMACSPFVFTKLLDFVGIYGLLLMPVGAIVFAEHWIVPRLGWNQFWASEQGAHGQLAGARRVARDSRGRDHRLAEGPRAPLLPRAARVARDRRRVPRTVGRRGGAGAASRDRRRSRHRRPGRARAAAAAPCGRPARGRRRGPCRGS